MDRSTGQLEEELAARVPGVRVLSSSGNVGPGGGRHRCIEAATQPLFASFDDDSWPIDSNYFSEMIRLFGDRPRTGILAASVYHPGETCPPYSEDAKPTPSYIGCGFAVRVEAYRQTSGHLDRACPYGFEELDLALQLYALDWTILQCSGLRVYHDTTRSHHSRPDLVAGIIQNAALLPYLRYPARLWPRAVLQVGNVVVDMLERKRFRGIGTGLWNLPLILRQYAAHRRVLSAAKIQAYLRTRQNTEA